MPGNPGVGWRPCRRPVRVPGRRHEAGAVLHGLALLAALVNCRARPCNARDALGADGFEGLAMNKAWRRQSSAEWASRAATDLCEKNQAWTTGWHRLRRQQRRVPRCRDGGRGTPFSRRALLQAHRAGARSRRPRGLGHGRGTSVRRRRRRAHARRAAWAGADWHAASSGVCTSDVELGAEYRSAPRVRRWTGLSRNKKCTTIIKSHRPSVASVVPCVVCRVSLLSCPLVSCPGSQSDKPLLFCKGPQKCWHKVISAQCSECQSNVSSNQRGCGSPMKAQAQASARVDVPTAGVFPVWTKESNTSASFCVNAWICAPQATDRDPQSFNVNAQICAQRATDRDLETKKWMLGYVHRDHEPTLDKNL